jgi:hypothetical protein
VHQQTEQYVQKPDDEDGNDDDSNRLGKRRYAWNEVYQVKDNATDNRSDDELKKQGYHIALITLWINSFSAGVLRRRTRDACFGDHAKDTFVPGAVSAAQGRAFRISQIHSGLTDHEHPKPFLADWRIQKFVYGRGFAWAPADSRGRGH